ncbi:MAG: homocysteine S-methyltransferase family protein [Gammaproteobacteria bacterium]|nr:homocysteine S-methyltransferase family protein [Gammaproteobacteria bacterium]
MPKYRQQLPQLDGDTFLTDGGLETTLVFHQGIELPYFAAFDLLNSDAGCSTLYRYFDTYCRMARENATGFILESATWRASADWGGRLGYDAAALAAINRKAIAMLSDVRDQYETEASPMVISGCIGPRGDGYRVEELMTAEEAEQYHAVQIRTFAASDADMVSAFTMTNIPEAIGISRAAERAGIPVVISFTLETDGCLPSGDSLKEAIEAVDTATDSAPVYYMINCAHPTHFDHVLADEPWLRRIRGVRANASCMSHAELDQAEELDDGNPEELGAQYRLLQQSLANLNVLGGCCGTDHRHVDAICRACVH